MAFRYVLPLSGKGPPASAGGKSSGARAGSEALGVEQPAVQCSAGSQAAPLDAAKEAHQPPPKNTQEVARAGTSGPSTALPYQDQIQRAFGPHDVSGIKAYLDVSAASASKTLRAEAFTFGSRVAFSKPPDLLSGQSEDVPGKVVQRMVNTLYRDWVLENPKGTKLQRLTGYMKDHTVTDSGIYEAEVYQAQDAASTRKSQKRLNSQKRPRFQCELLCGSKLLFKKRSHRQELRAPNNTDEAGSTSKVDSDGKGG